MLVCLARHICRMPNKVARLNFIQLMRDRKHSPDFIAEIQTLVREQWVVLHAQAAQGEGDHGHA